MEKIEKKAQAVPNTTCAFFYDLIYIKNHNNVIIQININCNGFCEDYEKSYFKSISKDSIRKELNIPDSDDLNDIFYSNLL